MFYLLNCLGSILQVLSTECLLEKHLRSPLPVLTNRSGFVQLLCLSGVGLCKTLLHSSTHTWGVGRGTSSTTVAKMRIRVYLRRWSTLGPRQLCYRAVAFNLPFSGPKESMNCFKEIRRSCFKPDKLRDNVTITFFMTSECERRLFNCLSFPA